MNYAACLWRQNVLAAPDIKTPEDWAPCAKACRDGQCAAVTMRQEEVLAGKSIYFMARDIVRRAADSVRQWVMPTGYGTKDSKPIPKAKPKATSALDAMGDAGDLASAITLAATEAASKPIVATEPAKPIPAALPGESPLQMARRLAAERNAHGQA